MKMKKKSSCFEFGFQYHIRLSFLQVTQIQLVLLLVRLFVRRQKKIFQRNQTKIVQPF